MAKAKKEAPPKKGCPAWQGTFGDLMNLLLCFFVLLFSMSTLDAAKYEEVAASFSAAFGIFNGGQNALGDGALIGDGVSQLSSLSAYTTSMGASASGDADETTDATSGEDVSEGGPDVSEAEATLEAAQMEASEQLAKEVTEALQSGMTEEEKAELTEEEVISDVILNYTSQYVQLTISGSLLFASGSAQLQFRLHR